jgi:hypothetical protein
VDKSRKPVYAAIRINRPSGESMKNIATTTFFDACKEASTRLRNNSTCDELEKKTLLAIIEKPPEEAKRLLRIVSRRNKLGLKVIKAGKEALLPPS